VIQVTTLDPRRLRLLKQGFWMERIIKNGLQGRRHNLEVKLLGLLPGSQSKVAFVFNLGKTQMHPIIASLRDSLTAQVEHWFNQITI